MKKTIISIIIIAVASIVAMPLKAQLSQGQRQSSHTMTPAIAFQSTSTMVGSGSTYASQPMLNMDGTASYKAPSYGPAYAPGGPRKSSSDPINPEEDDVELPVGDGTWILMFLAIGYAFFVAWRRMVAKR